MHLDVVHDLPGLSYLCKWISHGLETILVHANRIKPQCNATCIIVLLGIRDDKHKGISRVAPARKFTLPCPSEFKTYIYYRIKFLLSFMSIRVSGHDSDGPMACSRPVASPGRLHQRLRTMGALGQLIFGITDLILSLQSSIYLLFACCQ